MNEELKELLNNLKSVYELNKPLTEKYKEDCMRFIINTKEAELLLDYITNLQKENEELNRMCEIYSQSLYNADLKKAEQEVDRLNNIINELEKYLEEESKYDEYVDVFYRKNMGYVLDKLKELKNGDNNE